MKLSLEPCRLYGEEDYALVRRWWAGQEMQPVPEWLLPPCGVLAPAAAAWLFFADRQPVGWVAFLTADPWARPPEVHASVLGVLAALHEVAREHRMALLFTQAHTPSIQRLLERRAGWRLNQPRAAQYFKEVG